MSLYLYRFIYRNSVIGGWSAFAGWLVSELLFRSESGGIFNVAVVCAVVGALLGAGLSFVGGMSNGQWRQQLKRALPGLAIGAAGGFLGGFLGELLFRIGAPRAFGWLLLGAVVGAGQGAFERSRSKLRNGLIGGAAGGFAGGLLFDWIRALIGQDADMTSRAAAFVLLGACIGAFVGVVQVVLKQAWLTVIDGWRPNRQLILSEGVTILGRAEYAALPFLGESNRGLEPEHVKIRRESNGRYVAESLSNGAGAFVNGQKVFGQVELKDNDVIKLEGNYVRFNERAQKPGGLAPAVVSKSQLPPQPQPQQPKPTPAPPPAPPQRPPAPPSPTLKPQPPILAKPPLNPAPVAPIAASPPTPPPASVPPSAPAPSADPGPPKPVYCRNGHVIPRVGSFCIICDE